MSDNRAHCYLALFGLTASCAVSAADQTPESDPPEDVATSAQAVQTAMSARFAYATTTDEAVRATGAIFIPRRLADGTFQKNQGIDVRYTCGVTFISPRYAITAAHCVAAEDVPDPAAQALVVETYDIAGLSQAKIEEVRKVGGGTYPNFSAPQLTESDGYKVQRYNDCRVIHRCADGRYNCDFNADIALVRCADRSPFAPWVRVASSDPATGPVSMNWAHEVLDMPVEEPIVPDPGPFHDDPSYLRRLFEYAVAKHLFDHYTFLPSDRGENFHYLAHNQLLPLRSRLWGSGFFRAPPQRVGKDGTEVWTDLFGCHGTSGAGVMQFNAGHYELLGPVAHGDASLNFRLCIPPDAAQRGKPLISYTSHSYTHALAQTAYNDKSEWWWLKLVGGTKPALELIDVPQQQLTLPVQPAELH